MKSIFLCLRGRTIWLHSVLKSSKRAVCLIQKTIWMPCRTWLGLTTPHIIKRLWSLKMKENLAIWLLGKPGRRSTLENRSWQGPVSTGLKTPCSTRGSVSHFSSTRRRPRSILWSRTTQIWCACSTCYDMVCRKSGATVSHSTLCSWWKTQHKERKTESSLANGRVHLLATAALATTVSSNLKWS